MLENDSDIASANSWYEVHDGDCYVFGVAEEYTHTHTRWRVNSKIILIRAHGNITAAYFAGSQQTDSQYGTSPYCNTSRWRFVKNNSLVSKINKYSVLTSLHLSVPRTKYSVSSSAN